MKHCALPQALVSTFQAQRRCVDKALLMTVVKTMRRRIVLCDDDDDNCDGDNNGKYRCNHQSLSLFYSDNLLYSSKVET